MVAKSKRQLRPHDVRKPPLPKVVPPGANQQSPVPQGIELQAQRLVHTAGSAERAKAAIDSAIDRESAGDFRQDAFAARWGFKTRAELLAASKPLFSESSWWVTEVDKGRWIVWGHDDLSANKTFGSLEEAKQAVGDTPTAAQGNPSASG